MRLPGRAALAATLVVGSYLAGVAIGPAAFGGTASTGLSVGALYGDPVAAAAYWRRQSYNDCAEIAVADVVGQLTGRQPIEEEVVTLAENTLSTAHPGPIYDRRGPAGTYNPDVGVLLAHYGIRSTTDVTVAAAAGSAADLETVKQSLAHGRKVIVGVNSNILWDTRGGDRTRQNHFVVVTGVDTGMQVAHLNDSGIDHGRDEQVPLATFLAAWAAGYNMRTITDAAQPGDARATARLR